MENKLAGIAPGPEKKKTCHEESSVYGRDNLLMPFLLGNCAETHAA